MSGKINSNAYINKSDKWYALIEEWHATALLQAQFCRERGLSISQFYYWSKKWRKLHNKLQPKVVSNTEFKALHNIVPPTNAVNSIVCKHSSGVSIELPLSELSALTSVVQALGAVLC